MFLIFSTSLNPQSRSRVLANAARQSIFEFGERAEIIDLAERQLPFCDADACYSHPESIECGAAIRRAQAVLIATPVYNFGVSAAAKNLVELTGQAWREKIVGFLAAAGGPSSYMSVMGLANSLMLDFRSLVVPRFVYATEEAFGRDSLIDLETQRRVVELCMQTVWMANALHPAT